MARIFISYRHDDSGYVSALLSEQLQGRFGPQSVFFDIDHIPIGVDFVERINQAVGACDVLVVVIGDRWLEARDDNGDRRLEDPSDYVRVEIEAAFRREIPVVPVLVDKARMPAAAALPESLRSLVHRNAAEIRAGLDFKRHLERFVEALGQIVPPPGTGAPPRARKRAARTPGPPPAAAPTPARPVLPMEQVEASIGRLKDKYLFVGKAIPSDKARNARTAYAPRVKQEQILLLYDNTMFGGAKEGLLLTGDRVYWRNSWLSTGSKRYRDIDRVDVAVATVAGIHIIIDGEKITIVMGQIGEIAEAIADILRAASRAARDAIRRGTSAP